MNAPVSMLGGKGGAVALVVIAVLVGLVLISQKKAPSRSQ